MYIKTVKPQITSDSDNAVVTIMNYIENLKEEISFMIDSLNKRIDAIEVIAKSLGGDNT